MEVKAQIKERANSIDQAAAIINTLPWDRLNKAGTEVDWSKAYFELTDLACYMHNTVDRSTE